MDSRPHVLPDGQQLVVREAAVADAVAVLDYLNEICGESDFLSFGPGEFELSAAEEREFLQACRDSDNQLYLLGTINDQLVSSLNFSAGRRPRLRHCGEFGLSVRRAAWGLGIGSIMMDTLIEWARTTEIVTKVNLRVRTDNDRAIRLYEKKGFVNEGVIRMDVRIDDTYFDHLCMGLVLENK